ncbi:fimbrial protein [Escherichia coli]|uniref:fimbrial protein n=1 Tax=Escherichia coli TaxID=562 RepID=UPI000CFB0B79|nr:fimbrial protein [Escherichia coli]MDD8489380.1 fimbrial protein [Escherichia coli]HAI0066946.1 fimbrial protein [Escherichia coli]HCA7190226.1 fimbrial protein [Escherichia coli]HCA7466263.1 fimbrial protein [Escherichia coli]
MKIIYLAVSGIALLVCGAMNSVAVAGESQTRSLTLRVLVDGPPPCSVKGSRVEFGNVVINEIDGNNYRRNADYTLDCSNSLMSDLQLQLKGTTTVINGEKVISTDIAGFGIRIENAADNSLFAVGENNWTAFNINNQPQLKAVPVKENGVQLTAAEFNATMTMVVDYQ